MEIRGQRDWFSPSTTSGQALVWRTLVPLRYLAGLEAKVFSGTRPLPRGLPAMSTSPHKRVRGASVGRQPSEENDSAHQGPLGGYGGHTSEMPEQLRGWEV